MNKLDALLNYQEADAKLMEYENKLRNSPARQKLLQVKNYLLEQQEKWKQFEKETFQRQARYEKLKEYYDQATVEFKEIEEKYLEASKDTKEDLDIIRRQYENIQNSLAKLRRELVKVIKEMNDSEQMVVKMYNSVNSAKKEFTELKDIHQKELDDAKDDMEKAKKAVLTAGKKVDKELLERYSKVRKTKPNPVALVVEDKCGGCNMELPYLTLSKIKENNDIIVECENCGRILYYKK